MKGIILELPLVSGYVKFQLTSGMLLPFNHDKLRVYRVYDEKRLFIYVLAFAV